ncbi:uncharacterized protein LOC141797090 [Halichoeres trimaculatus]|uniref:uncharacterized protein LOC141797090 n=1 Tax=Halichoeres trimaculatus TaxID=147232 RepID=UPI003D9F3ADD
MDSWMDQGCQQFQFPPQSSKPTAWQRDIMGNLQARSVGPSHQYWTSNAGAHPPQSYQYPSSDWQARATSCKQIPTGQHNPNHWGVNGHFQSGNPQSTAGVGAQQGFPQNCPQSSAAQGPTSIGLYQQVTPGSTYTTAANSFPHGHWSDTLAYNTHNLNHRQNSSQDRPFSSVCPPPEYFSAVNQSFRQMTTKSSSSQQAVSRSQRAQPHHAPVSRGQYNTSSCSRADRLPEHTSDRTSGRVITKIAENLCKSVSSSHPARYYGKQYVSHSQNQSQNQNQNQSQNRNQKQNQNQSQNQNWSQNQSQVRGSELNHHTQVAGNDSHTFQSVPLCSTQSSPKTTLSRAAKRSKAPETKTKDSYQSPDQPSRYASQPEYSSPVFTAMSKGVSTGDSVDRSPDCVGTRAVAVVQPLLQESCHQDARHNTSPDMTKQPPEPAATYELPRRKSQEFRKSPKKSKQTTSEECETSDPLGSADPLLDPAADLTQNQPTGPEPAAADIQDHQNVSPALSEPAAEAPESVVELSSVPTIPHTPGMMMKLIQELNEDNMNHIRKSSHCSTASKLMDMFWDGDLKIFVTYLKKKVFSQIGYEADAFCREHVTKDTVIMSGVKEDNWKAVKGHRILKHDEVYTEPPYRPFWLIDNEKLDDIEKEFGLPWPLRRRLHTMESDIQRDQGDSISEEILRDVSETVLALTEQEQVDLSGRKSSCSDETTSTKSATSEESSDPYGALEIKVLPPEEALLIFEQAVMGTAAQSGSQASCSAEAKLLEVVNLTLRDLEQEGAAISPVDQVSCLEEYQSAKDPLKDARTCKEEGQLENNKMHGISSDCMSNPTEGEDPDPTEREHPDPMEGEHPDPMEGEHPDPTEREHSDSMEREHSDPTEREHPDPMEGEHPDPMEGEHPDPMEGEHPDHTERKHPDLMEGEHPDPTKREHPDSMQGEHSDPTEREHPDLMQGEHSDPTEREHPDSMQGEHSDPTEREHPDPMQGEHSDPTEREHPDPMQGEHSDPTEREHPDSMQGEHPDLMEGEHSDPTEREHPDLMEGEHPDPTKREHPDLMEGEHSDPTEREHPDLMQGEHSDPTEREHPDSMQGEHSDPTEREHPDPMQGEHSDPTEREHPDPMQGEHSDPTEREHPDSMQGEHPDLMEGEHSDPTEREHPDLMQGKHSDPTEREHPDSMQGEHSDPTEREHPDPMQGEHSDPTEREHPDSMQGEHPDPTEREHPDLMEGEHSDPTEREHPDLMEGEHPDPTKREHPDLMEGEHSDPMEGEHPARVGGSCNTQTIIYVETVDSLENRETDSFQEVLNSSQFSDTLITEEMDNVLLGCENIAPEPVDTDTPGRFTGLIQLSEKETRNLSLAEADRESCSETDSLCSLKTREPAKLHTSLQAAQRKQEGLQDYVGSPNRSVKPLVQDAPSEKQKELAGVIESKCSSFKYRTVKMALFGSSQQAQYSTVGKMRHVFASEAMSTRPPEVLSVSLSPLKRKINEAVPSEELSPVKLRIYENWRKSLPPTQIRYKKFKSQKFLSSSSASPKKSDRTGRLKQPLYPEKRIYDVKVISGRGRLASNELKHRKEKRGRRRHAEKLTDQPHQDNIILKFSVLPETFSFRDEPHNTESTTDPAPNTTEHAERKHSNKSDIREKGTWSKHSEKKYCPLMGKTSSIFQEFKKKYKKLSQQE